MRRAWRKWAVCGGLSMGLAGCRGTITGDCIAVDDIGAADDGPQPTKVGEAGVYLLGGAYGGFALFEDATGDCSRIYHQIDGCEYLERSKLCQAREDGGTVMFESPIATVSVTAENPSFADTAPFFHPGQTVQIRSTGADVPAFSCGVVTPPALQLTSPTFIAVESVAASQDLVFTWPAMAGRVTAQIGQNDNDTARSLSCVFDGEAGTGTIPSEAIATLPHGPGVTGTLYVSTEARKLVIAGGWTVTLFAVVEATDPLGNGALMDLLLHY